ncbi:AAA family ATPase [Vibrio mimicus]
MSDSVVDLNNLFKTSPSKLAGGSSARDLIVSDSADFIESALELYAIEGFTTPLHQIDFDLEAQLGQKDLKLKHVILDLRKSDDLLADVSALASLLDVSISLIVVSQIDSIRIRDKVRSLGATYVLWDEELDGLLAALRQQTPQEVNTQSKTRVAKRILLLGSKGGIGLSTLAAALSHALVEQANLKVLLVDHDSGALNSDIYLGVKGLRAKQNSIDLNQTEIDEAIAATYVNKVADKLDYLILEKSTACLHDHAAMLFNLSSELVGGYNFIIDAVPFNSFEEIHDRELSEKYHRVYVLCEPSVSSLRSYNSLKKKMGKTEHSVVFSQTRNSRDYMVDLTTAKERIKCRASIDLPYESALEKTVIQQGLSSLLKGRYGQPVGEIVTALTGKKAKPVSRFRLFKK